MLGADRFDGIHLLDGGVVAGESSAATASTDRSARRTHTARWCTPPCTPTCSCSPHPKDPQMTEPTPVRPAHDRVRPSCTAAGEVPLSVWATAQGDARAQRAGRYPPAATAHPGKMLPAIAATAITRYTAPGDLVADPMCGIGTTVIEAIHLGRNAIGVEYEPPLGRDCCRGVPGWRVDRAGARRTYCPPGPERCPGTDQGKRPHRYLRRARIGRSATAQ
jgi:DNA methylase